MDQLLQDGDNLSGYAGTEAISVWLKWDRLVEWTGYSGTERKDVLVVVEQR